MKEKYYIYKYSPKENSKVIESVILIQDTLTESDRKEIQQSLDTKDSYLVGTSECEFSNKVDKIFDGLHTVDQSLLEEIRSVMQTVETESDITEKAQSLINWLDSHKHEKVFILRV